MLLLQAVDGAHLCRGKRFTASIHSAMDVGYNRAGDKHPIYMTFWHNVKCAVSPPTVPPYRLRLGLHRHRPGVGVTAEHPNPLLA